jgi:hypothetical protein
MPRVLLPWLAGALLLTGCNDTTSPRDLRSPAAPRGVASVTGDHEVFLTWLENTEADLVGYHVYEGSCARGVDCPYERVGSTTGSEFIVRGLVNGSTRFFAVSAYDRSGNESPLSYQDVFDTPRPEGFGLRLDNYLESPAISGYDFSAYSVVAFDHAEADVYFGSQNGMNLMITPFQDTDIQDAGFAASLDAVDFAPSGGWAPSGSVELVVGHCYVVHTHDDHYAKFRVTSMDAHRVSIDWAYQVDPGNRELRAQPVKRAGPRVRRTPVWGS